MRSEAVNADKRPVAGRRTLVVTAKGGLLVGDASTGTDNVVVFRYKTSKHDGVGEYTVTADAVNGADTGSADPATFTVN